MDKDAAYKKDLFQRLSQGPDIKKEGQLLNKFYQNAMLWLCADANVANISFCSGMGLCPKIKAGKSKACFKSINRALKSAQKSRSIEQFVCPNRGHGICLPLVQGDALYGFLILCNLNTAPSQQTLQLFEALNTEILEKLQKELELSKLYQTIRPRAIALSTIHTVRRLISSSLNLEELMPRIARLSLQVLRAKRCLISLVDKKVKKLLPQAFIDLSNKAIKPRLSNNIRRIESKVMHSSNALLKQSYLSVPLIDEEPIGVITVFQKMSKRPFDNFDLEILTALAEQAVGAIKNAQLYKEQENMLLGTVQSLSALLKVKPGYCSHSKAFAGIVLGIAKELGLADEDMRNLRYAAMLHDAGKISIPEEILKKPLPLSGREFKIVKEHPRKSAKILSPLERLKPVVSIILHHHEKFDGTGYPDRLRRDEIPLGARIMAVADSFEAMVSRRPYRESTSIPQALKEIKKYSGIQFDPQVIRGFLKFIQTKAFRKLLKGAYRG